MTEFTITCGDCGSTNCRIETIHWARDNYSYSKITCDDCDGNDDE